MNQVYRSNFLTAQVKKRVDHKSKKKKNQFPDLTLLTWNLVCKIFISSLGSKKGRRFQFEKILNLAELHGKI